MKKVKIEPNFKNKFKTIYCSTTKKLGSKTIKIKKSLPRVEVDPRQRGSLTRAWPQALGKEFF